jgi:hypothetical protein
MIAFGTKLYTSIITLNGDIKIEQCRQVTDSIIAEMKLINPHYTIVNEKSNNAGYYFFQSSDEMSISWDILNQIKRGYLMINHYTYFDVNIICKILRHNNIMILDVFNHETI